MHDLDVDHLRAGPGLRAADELLAADGARIRVVSVADGGWQVGLRLVLDDASCSDCVLPHADLVEVITAMASDAAGRPVEILLDDPRLLDSTR